MKKLLTIFAVMAAFLFFASAAPADDFGLDDESEGDIIEFGDEDEDFSQEEEYIEEDSDYSGDENYSEEDPDYSGDEDYSEDEDFPEYDPEDDLQDDEFLQEEEEEESEDARTTQELAEYNIASRTQRSGISVEFEQSSAIIRQNSSAIFTPKVTNFGGKITYEYESSDEKVATVAKGGKVRGVGVGNAVITCTVTTDGEEIQANYLLKVVKPVKKIYSDIRNVSMHSGEELKPVLTITPEDATIKKINWTTTDAKVAQVTRDGTIHANRVGMCMIIGTAADGLGAEIRIRVVVPRVSLSQNEILIDDPSGAEFTYWVNAMKKSVKVVTGCYEQCVKASASTSETRKGVDDGDLPVAEEAGTTIRLTPTQVGKDKYFVTANKHDYVVDIKVARTAVYLPVKCGGLGSRVKDSGQRYEVTGTVVSVSGDELRTLILQAKNENEQYAWCIVPADVVMDGLGDPGDEVRIDGILQGRTQYTDENRHYHWAPKIMVEQIIPNDRPEELDTEDEDEENQDDGDISWSADDMFDDSDFSDSSWDDAVFEGQDFM